MKVFPPARPTLAARAPVFFAVVFLAGNLFSPGGAMAADTTIIGGTYTGIYGNSGTAAVPPDSDPNANGNTLTLGNGSAGPTISNSSITIAGGSALGTSAGSSGSASGNRLTVNHGTSLAASAGIAFIGGLAGWSSGNANNNTVIIDGFDQSNDNVVIDGGVSYSNGEASANNVTINSGNTNNFAGIFGGLADGAAQSNTVTINGGGEINGSIAAGSSSYGFAGGSADHNIVNISGGSANIQSGGTFSTIWGGFSRYGSASYNEVHIGSGYTGTIGDANVSTGNLSISGGMTGDFPSSSGGGGGSADHNIVEIAGGTILSGVAVSGGRAINGAVVYNTVSISGGTVGGDIYGGSTRNGSATANIVSITTSGKAYQNIYGGYAETEIYAAAPGDLFSGNTLNLQAGNTVSSVHNMEIINFTSSGSAGIDLLDATPSGASGAPQVTLNTDVYTVAFGGVISGSGGLSKTGAGTLTLSGLNTYSGGTTVNNGILAGSIAANTDLTVAGGATYDGTGAARSVNVLSGAGNIINDSGLSAQSGAFSGGISGSGGLSKTGGGTLTLSGLNTYSGMTTVNNGILAGSIAANTDLTVAGGATYDGTGAARSVNVLSGAGNIINDSGLSAQSGAFSGGISGSGGINKTGAGTLTLSGLNTYSGMTTVNNGILELGASGSLASRTLTLRGGAVFRDGSGGYSLNGGVLNLRGKNAIYDGNLSAAGGLLNFYAPASMTGGETMLNVSGAADISGGTVNLGIDGAGSPLKRGDSLILIDAAALTGAPVNRTADGRGMQGITLRYEFEILADAAGGRLLARVSSAPSVNPQIKALSEGFSSGLSLVTQGADLIAGPGMLEAVNSARRTEEGGARESGGAQENDGSQEDGGARAGVSPGYGLGTFGTLSGGSLRYNTGSHVDLQSMSMLAGLSWGHNFTPGYLTLGTFFEYGSGSYDTYNSFSNAASVHGEGNIYHMGGGLLGRLDFRGSGSGHFYGEASVRAGGLHNSYASSDLGAPGGGKANYDSSSAYYGLHLGGGYVWDLTAAASLDLYGKYFWTHQEGDSLTLSGGDPVTFRDADSQRLRAQ
ncbi:MAG: autotransporter-associated beta strand repeat-containing protein [Desulfarculales bacterium]|jgi:autotransporter-associated beta strand protein|nr:autotransporter-associated beta strand repeat-containing protein [Desulfarculales bacterium]